MMKAVAVLLVLCCLAVSEGLECYSCDYPCVITSKTTCGLLQTCDTRTATKGSLRLTAKGCTDGTKCLSTETNSILNIDYTVTHSCCLTDLCNAAPAVKVSLVACLATLLPLVLMKLL